MSSQQAQDPRQLEPVTGRCPSHACSQPLEGARCGHCGVAARAGRWTIERVLAQSGHSRVYLARDAQGVQVALKELHFALVPGTRELDAFEREAKMLAALQHPATPRFVESFSEGTGLGTRLYLAAEYVRGESLADRLARGPLPEAEVRRVARALLQVLVHLQSRAPAVFHRDVKPANVMFREDGAVVLVDFGAVRTVDGSRTHRSTLVGTFGYMPPEQLGGTVDRTSDVFALAATMLHALTGQPPAETLGADLTPAIPPSLSPALRAWLGRALAFERAARFSDARAALAALDDARATRARPRLLRAALVGVLLSLLGGLAATSVIPDAAALPGPIEAPTPSGWFARVKSGCNQLEVSGVMAQQPPPAGPEGRGDGAGCYALAGRFADARRLIETLPVGQPRAVAAWRVFEIAHPVADRGDDAAAGPMMELVLEYWPDNYQALYHAGMAEYAAGDAALAKTRLEDFLRRYQQNDGFTQQARAVLARIAQGQPADPGMVLGRH